MVPPDLVSVQEAVGLARSEGHDLFPASVALQTGQNTVVMSKRLGHSNVSVTSDTCAHSLPGWQRQAFAAAMREDDHDTGTWKITAIVGG